MEGVILRTNQLILYKNMEHEKLLKDMTFLMENSANDYCNKEDMVGLLFDCMNELLEMTASHGFEGNLWQNYLTFLLANDENAYSTACEVVGEVNGSINQIALHDLEIFRELFAYDLHQIEQALDIPFLPMITEYENAKGHGKVFNQRIRDSICHLSRELAISEN